MRRIDPLTKAERSERMSRVRAANTNPEMAVRRLVHRLGYRYSLHAKGLPGHPDLAFKARRKVIFVHGCFWHQHGCRQYRMPRTRTDFWEPKLQSNKIRDAIVRRQLRELGLGVLVVWECQIKDVGKLRDRLSAFLEAS
ncbi:MAG: very short patch repair endonuclease [Polyangiaceae bacterium]